MNATAWCQSQHEELQNTKMDYGIRPLQKETDFKVIILLSKYSIKLFKENKLFEQIIDSAPIVTRNVGNMI